MGRKRLVKSPLHTGLLIILIALAVYFVTLFLMRSFETPYQTVLRETQVWADVPQQFIQEENLMVGEKSLALVFYKTGPDTIACAILEKGPLFNRMMGGITLLTFTPEDMQETPDSIKTVHNFNDWVNNKVCIEGWLLWGVTKDDVKQIWVNGEEACLRRGEGYDFTLFYFVNSEPMDGIGPKMEFLW